MGKRKGEYRILVGKPDGKRPLGNLLVGVDGGNVKMDLKEIG
jgi:hypothetical protein